MCHELPLRTLEPGVGQHQVDSHGESGWPQARRNGSRRPLEY
jgi:hypothetical protein